MNWLGREFTCEECRGIWPAHTTGCSKASALLVGSPTAEPPLHPRIFDNPGWTCPACGGGNAPSSSRCPCKPLPPMYPTCCAPPLDAAGQPPAQWLAHGVHHFRDRWAAD